MPITLLPDRGALEVAGEDRVAFLQGLVSNDVAEAAPGRAVWAALLTPQGKWLADFFVFSDGERLLLDCEREQAPALAARLSRFRLRSRVSLRDASAEFAVHAGWGGAAVSVSRESTSVPIVSPLTARTMLFGALRSKTIMGGGCRLTDGS